MKKRLTLALALFFMLASFLAAAGDQPMLSISGAVRQPLNLSLEDLQEYQTTRVQLNEIMTDGQYNGVFYYRGVPLRILLETAYIEKEETTFSKRTDLAVVVKNSKGQQVTLSWGEIFYRNPGDYILATSAIPIIPHRDCSACHESDEYQPRLDRLQRKIDFPKLVISRDVYSDRSLGGITCIDILALRPKTPSKKGKVLFSEKLKVMGQLNALLTIDELFSFPRRSAIFRHVGEGRGYHGSHRVEGTSLKSILEKSGVDADLSQVFLVSAPDGYRSLFSYGEIFLNPVGERIILADTIDGQSIEKGGRFWLISPDDAMADRTVKAVSEIEKIHVQENPKLYVIGVGCGDTNLISLEAISYMAKADLFICPSDISDRFSKYMGGKPILFDMIDFSPYILRKEHPEFSRTEIDELMKKKRAESAQTILQALGKGKSVAILDYGDPSVWGSWRYIDELIADDLIEMVPGLSSFNVANAALGIQAACRGSIVMSTPRGITENPAILQAVAKNEDTLVIFVGLGEVPKLMPLFLKHYSKSTPAAVVYRAGYSGSEHIVRTTIEGLQQAVESDPKEFLGLIYIGACMAAQ